MRLRTKTFFFLVFVSMNLFCSCGKKNMPIATTKTIATALKTSLPTNYNDSIHTGTSNYPKTIPTTLDRYQKAYSKITEALRGNSNLSFTQAVFEVENTWFGDSLDYQAYIKQIKFLASLSNKYANTNSLLYDGVDKDTVKIHAAVFNVMTKSTPIRLANGSTSNYPAFEYDFEDYTGDKDWASMMVVKLLETHKGNCHSLPFLYKMVCEQLNVPVYFALAPNHLFVKNHTQKKGWENIELTSSSFTYDAWMMASGYIHPDAVRNALYLDTLGETKCLALCLLDLAHGYERKDTVPNIDFVLQCTQTALRYFPNYAAALLKQAETHKKQLSNLCDQHKVSNWQQLPPEARGKQLFETMQNEYTKLYGLGYRPMPDSMYQDWLNSLKQAHNEK